MSNLDIRAIWQAIGYGRIILEDEDQFIWEWIADDVDDAWEQACDVEKVLKRLGLRVIDRYTDHDTVQVMFRVIE